MISARRFERLAPLLLLLAGFGLRVFRLSFQSIWHDEADSIYVASHNPVAIIGLSANDIHPPLHDWLLHFWMLAVGNREFSTRFVSVFFGVLTIALVFQLGRMFFDRKGAVLSTLVAVVAPFLIYYSQETRSYSLALFLSVFSVFACLKWLRGEGSRWWLVGYVVASAAAVYSHYYAWLIFGFLNIFVVLRIWTAGSRPLARFGAWVSAQVVVALIFLPWVGVLLNKYETYGAPVQRADLGVDLYQTLVSFGVGYWAGQAGAIAGQKDLFPDHWIVFSLALLLLALAIWGLLRGGLREGRWGAPLDRAFLPLYLVLPLAEIMILSWVGKLEYVPRYMLFPTPAYYLLIGGGIASLFTTRRLFGTLALVAVLGTMALPLRNYYFDPTYSRDDIRGVAQFIQDHAGENDAIILNTYYMRPEFMYYYKGSAPVVDLPADMPANWDQDLPALEQLARQHSRIWLVLWQDYFTDPDKRVQGWLDKQGIRTDIKGFQGSINVLGYLTGPPLVDHLPSGQPLDVQLGGVVGLAGDQLPAGPVCAGGDTRFTIYWRALQPISVNYTVFVHVVDGQGKTVAQADSPPVGGGYPTTRWPVGPLVVDDRTIEIPANLPPGQYYLEVGMYDLATMKVLGSDGPGPAQYRMGPFQVSSGCKSAQ